MIQWAEAVKDWIFGQGWFKYFDSLLVSGTYDGVGILLVVVVLIIGLILIVSLGKSARE